MKTSKDYYKILEESIDRVASDKWTEDDLRRADVLANSIGKVTKLAALQIAYAEAQKKTPTKIDCLE